MWRRSLAELGQLLRDKAQREPGWAHFKLPHGAEVKCRQGKDGGFTFAIARRPAPDTPAALKKWRREVEIFTSHLGIRNATVDWSCRAGEEGLTESVGIAILHEPRQGVGPHPSPGGSDASQSEESG